MSKDNLSPREEFENNLFYFLQALRSIADIGDQTTSFDKHANFAWELRDELLDGSIAVRTAIDNGLTAVQQQLMSELEGQLAKLPKDAMLSKPSALEQPAWAPIKLTGKKLLQALQPLITRNEIYFSGRS